LLLVGVGCLYYVSVVKTTGDDDWNLVDTDLTVRKTQSPETQSPDNYFQRNSSYKDSYKQEPQDYTPLLNRISSPEHQASGSRGCESMCCLLSFSSLRNSISNFVQSLSQ